MKQNKMNVIMVNGTNPNADEVKAQVKETGCGNIIFTGIGLTKAKKLVINMTMGTGLNIRFKCFRKLNNASEDWVKDNFNVVSTIGDFCKGKGRKTTKKEVVEMDKEEAVSKANKFMDVVRENSSNIGLWGFDHFKELAMGCGATKTMRRGTKYYAYFGKMYVRF